MREYKFRAWDKENKRMTDIDGGNLYLAEGKVYEVCSGSFAMECTFEKKDVSDRYEIMQYTGLNDKDGREIYEGDILYVTCFERFNRLHKEYIGEVRYEMCYEVISHVSEDGDKLHLICNPYYEIEVIGNIYENPELITAGDA